MKTRFAVTLIVKVHLHDIKAISPVSLPKIRIFHTYETGEIRYTVHV